MLTRFPLNRFFLYGQRRWRSIEQRQRRRKAASHPPAKRGEKRPNNEKKRRTQAHTVGATEQCPACLFRAQKISDCFTPPPPPSLHLRRLPRHERSEGPILYHGMAQGQAQPAGSRAGFSPVF